RTEEAILSRHAGDVIGLLRPVELIELGSGAGRKVRLLLDAMARAGLLRRCVLLDINELYLRHSVRALSAAYPQAEVDGVRTDFDLDAFEHVAFYDRRRAWIEMRLRARRPTSFRVPVSGQRRRLRAGGEIRTEISCKYTKASLRARLRGTGLTLTRWYSDPDSLFAVAVLSAVDGR